MIYFDALQQTGTQHLKGLSSAIDDTNGRIFNIGSIQYAPNANMDAYIVCRKYASFYQAVWSKTYNSHLGAVSLTQSLYTNNLCMLGTIGSEWVVFFCVVGNTGATLGGFVITANQKPVSCYGLKRIADNLRFGCQFNRTMTTFVVNQASLTIGSVPSNYSVDTNISNYISSSARQIVFSDISGQYVPAGIELSDSTLVPIDALSFTAAHDTTPPLRQIWPNNIHNLLANYILKLPGSPSFSPTFSPTFSPSIAQTNPKLIQSSIPTLSSTTNTTQPHLRGSNNTEPSSIPTVQLIFTPVPTTSSGSPSTETPSVANTAHNTDRTDPPTRALTTQPTIGQTNHLRGTPSILPSKPPSKRPSLIPSTVLSATPSLITTRFPSSAPSSMPTPKQIMNPNIDYSNAGIGQIFSKDVVTLIVIMAGVFGLSLCVGYFFCNKCRSAANDSPRRKARSAAVAPDSNPEQKSAQDGSSVFSSISSDSDLAQVKETDKKQEDKGQIRPGVMSSRESLSSSLASGPFPSEESEKSGLSITNGMGHEPKLYIEYYNGEEIEDTSNLELVVTPTNNVFYYYSNQGNYNPYWHTNHPPPSQEASLTEDEEFITSLFRP